MANALQPIDKKRQALFQEMTEPTRQIATEFATKLTKASQGVTLTFYDIGARVAAVASDEAAYGSKAVEQLASYLNISGGATALYAYKNFATTFDKEYVRDTIANRQLANGQSLTLYHWLKLTQLRDQKTRERMLDIVCKKSLSANELEIEIRALSDAKKNVRSGGRKPRTPTSPIAGLQTVTSLTQKWNNLIPVLEETVFPAIDSMDDSDITPDLVTKLLTTKDKLEEMLSKGQKLLEHVSNNIDNMQDVINNTTNDDSDSSSEAASEEKPKKKKTEKEKPAKPSKADKPAKPVKAKK